jgi:broad specificity phosphatase PhoE
MPSAQSGASLVPHRLFLFRHGETDWNRERRLQGLTDIPLNETGRTQAKDLAERLRPHALEAIVTSDLVRAAGTARIVADALGIPVYVATDLREGSLGEAEGMLIDDAKLRFGAELVEGRVTDERLALPGGEPGLAVRARSLGAIARFVAERDYRRIGISTHSGVLRQILTHALPDGPIPRSRNGAHYVMDYDHGNARLVLVEPS